MRAKLIAIAVATAVGSPALAAPPRGGAVYTLSDDASANAVLAFARGADGALTPAGTYPTGGRGSGGGEGVLGSQGALTLTGDGRYLLAVDAGSDDVASFRVVAGHLVLAGRAPSGGELPVSVAEHDGLVYVLNAGSGSISGFHLGDDGELEPLAGSTRSLGAGVGPAQVGFDADGEALAITEKAANAIAVFQVDRRGLPVRPRTYPSAGMTPFGFAFTRRDVLVVSEAEGGAPGASTASSYDLDDGALEVVSRAVPDQQGAACWLVTTENGRHAFVANAASGTISSYRVDRRGAITLQQPGAAMLAGGKPLDLAFSRWDRYLYVLDAGTAAIRGFGVAADGTLAALDGAAGGLPRSAVGLAAR